jgi:dTDP-4-dehydrorhamnose reductase
MKKILITGGSGLVGNAFKNIANEFEYTEYMVFNANYSDGQYKKTADNRKLLSFLGGELKYKLMDIRKGIHRAVDFLKNNYDTCRK